MRTKTLLIISILFNIAFITIAAVKYHNSHQPVSITDQYNYKNGIARQSVFVTLPVDSSDIVFVGNSITQGFPVEEMFPDVHVKNRGISGNWTYQVVNRLPLIVASHPRKIFLEIGVNDLTAHVTIDSILTNYRKMISIVQSSPSTQLYIHSVTPTTYEYKNLNPQIRQLNDSLQVYCKRYSLPYIDLYSEMLKGNELDTSLTIDGLHYNGKGYAIWKQKVKELVN